MGAPTVAVLVNAGLTSYYNGNYYSQRVIANEARCRTLEIEKIKKNMIHVRILVEIVLLV
jgi:hypothetical protein